MKFLEICEEYFGSQNLYKVLNIPENASEKEVRKAYHKLSLSCHPDRVDESNKLHATEKFKVLGKVHSVLSDPEKRAVYDETGIWNDDDDDDEEGAFENNDWDEYWRRLFKKVTISDIKNYEEKYKGSEEELKDLIKTYNDWKGDMDRIYEFVPFVTLKDEERIRARLQDLIDAKEIIAYDLFTKEPQTKRDRRMRKLKKEEETFAKESRKLVETEDNGLDDLEKTILARSNTSFYNVIGSLAQKYGNPKSTEKSVPNKK